MSDSQLHQSTQAPDHPSPESLTINSSTEGEAEGDREATQQFSACWQEEQSEDDDTQSPTGAGDSSSDSDNSNGRRTCWPLPMHSSIEEQKPANERPRLQTSTADLQAWGPRTRHVRAEIPPVDGRNVGTASPFQSVLHQTTFFAAPRQACDHVHLLEGGGKDPV